MSERQPLAHYQRELAALGFRPSRRLGQNFLIDDNMLRAIVRDAGVVPGDLVLEVGPGLGFLTRQLAEAGAELVCVEIDARLLELARASVPAGTRVRWIRADVLAGKHALAPEVVAALPSEEPWSLVSNLPYSVSAPLLALLAGNEHPPERMTVLVQREVAERLAALPGSRDWGPLSVAVQLSYSVERLRELPPALFWPRPEVDSTLVALRRSAAPASSAERARVLELVARLFQRRRQSLGRVLGESWGRARAERVLDSLGLDRSARAERLGLDELRALALHSPEAAD